MCKLWQKKNPKELTFSQVEEVLDDPVFKTIENIVVTGGEPTLRADLDKIASLIVRKCPSLKSISVATNGLDTERAIKALHAFDDACKKTKIKYSFSISLDGVNEIHGKVRNVPNAFERTTATIAAFKELQSSLGFGLQVHGVITRTNLNGLPALKNWCRRRNTFFNFELAHQWKRFENDSNDFKLTPNEFNLYLTMLWNRVHDPSGSYFDWMNYRMFRQGQRRTISCPFVENGFGIQPNGDVFYCPNSDPIGNLYKEKISNILNDEKSLRNREWAKKNLCASCTQSCWWNASLNSNPLQTFQYTLLKALMLRTRGER